MIRGAWLTCALLSVVGAHIYERCELARELLALGVEPDHVSTWVCIAYHESRFDTAANNPHSGDHGIFQISQLYWCGPGKACGLPCSALRDEDISNDLECALHVHEEHTRLQGNGFLAWVVYPQHCKHNTKKYLVDCDTSVKNSVPITRSRVFHYDYNYDEPNVTHNTQYIQGSLPTFLTISSIFRESYGKVLEHNKGNVDWYHYKIDNIDELKLPMLNKPSQPISMPPTSTPTTTTLTTTTTYIPPVMPWRRIETNQFRKKQLFSDGSTQKPTTNKWYTTEKLIASTKSTTGYQLPREKTTIRPLSIATTVSLPNITTTTFRTTSVTRPTSTASVTRPPTYSTITWKPITTTVTPWKIVTSTYKPPTTTTLKPSSTATTRTPTTITSTPRSFFSTTTVRPRVTTVRPTVTTVRPTVTTTTTFRPTVTTTTTVRPTVTTTTRAVTQKLKPDFSWYTFTSRAATTTPATTKLQIDAQTKSSQSVAGWTKLQTDTQFKSTWPVAYSTTTNKPQTTQKPRTTQSIFDLYLNPTKPPKLPSYQFNWAPESQFRVKIFAGGTTTQAPSKQSTAQEQSADSNGGAKNYIRRQT